MQQRGSANKSPIILNAAENKFDTGDLFTNGENHRGKIPPGEFKVTTPELQQAITSKRILVPYTNLQLNPYPNTQLNLFCSNNLSFSMHSSQYVTNQSMHGSMHVTNHQLEKHVSCKVLQFINTMKIMKLLGYKTLAASSRERRTRANLSPVTICLNKTFASSFINCDGPQNNYYICLGL